MFYQLFSTDSGLTPSPRLAPRTLEASFNTLSCNINRRTFAALLDFMEGAFPVNVAPVPLAPPPFRIPAGLPAYPGIYGDRQKDIKVMVRFILVPG